MPALHARPCYRCSSCFRSRPAWVDAVSVLGLAKVFTANMTGNIVSRASRLRARPASGGTGPVALVTFMGGALMAGRISESIGGVRSAAGC
jgi:uncharacterized membrane protein YoaK (UPF0700 family)